MFIMELLDIVSYSPSISVFGKPKYKSTPGKIIGAMTLLFIIGLSMYFIVEVFGRYDVTVLYREAASVNSQVKLKAPFAIFLADAFAKPIPDQFHEIRVNKWIANYTNAEKPLVTTEIKLETCTHEKHFNDSLSKEVFKDIKDVSFFKCIPNDSEDFVFEGKWGDWAPYSFINIVVNMCNNQTMNNTCPHKAQLEPILKNTYLTIIYIDHEIDHGNFNQPIKPYLRSEPLPINWDIHLRYFYYFKNLLYSTDVGYVFESIETQQNYIFSRFDQTLQVRQGSALYPNITIGTLSLTKNIRPDIYLRSFPKIQTLMAKIGGVIQGINFVSIIIAHYFTKNLFLVSVLNSFFYVENEIATEPASKQMTTMNNNVTVNNLKENIDLVVHCNNFMERTTKIK